ncbi:hypothetical protein [Fibrobacter sp.]|uniref:hypothetical protein n=1 Tax=Fibrobacter sp. TaxID=35828 RepID=UPI0025C690DB|nr:hypothetical protein [Fibrobacter sp.]MBR4008262.1 hypothetical protein [Fibrobacter sp.]
MNKKFAISPPKISLYVVKQGGEGGVGALLMPLLAVKMGKNPENHRHKPPARCVFA